MNPLAELIARKRPAHYWTIRYEDLSENPRVFVEAIAAKLLGKPVECSFFHGNRAAIVKVQHILAGNPDKLHHSGITIERRKTTLSPATNLLVSFLTFPFLVRYGYILRHAPWLTWWRVSFAYGFLQSEETCRASQRQVISAQQ